MSELITTCPKCSKVHSEAMDVTHCHCPYCNHRYHPWEQDEDDVDHADPDYGGAFDGFTVTSDADQGL